MSKEAECCICGQKEVMHIDDEEGYCCLCWVLMGNPPADWHIRCMNAYDSLNEYTGYGMGGAI